MYDNLYVLIGRAKDGSKEAKAEILKQYEKYIMSRAHKYTLSCMDFEDLVSQGMITVLSCIDKYDEKKNSNFTSYVTCAINNNLLDMKIKDYRKTCLNNDDDGTLLSALGSDDDGMTSYIESRELKRAMRKLPMKDLKLLYDIYFKGISMRDIAKRLGLSYTTICHRKNSAVRRLYLLLK